MNLKNNIGNKKTVIFKGRILVNVDLCPHKSGIKILRINEIPPLRLYDIDRNVSRINLTRYRIARN